MPEIIHLYRRINPRPKRHRSLFGWCVPIAEPPSRRFSSGRGSILCRQIPAVPRMGGAVIHDCGCLVFGGCGVRRFGGDDGVAPKNRGGFSGSLRDYDALAAGVPCDSCGGYVGFARSESVAAVGVSSPGGVPTGAGWVGLRLDHLGTFCDWDALQVSQGRIDFDSRFAVVEDGELVWGCLWRGLDCGGRFFGDWLRK